MEKFQKKLNKLLTKYGVGEDKLAEAMDFFASLKDEDEEPKAEATGDDPKEATPEKVEEPKVDEEPKEEPKEEPQKEESAQAQTQPTENPLEVENETLKKENADLNVELAETKKTIKELRDVNDSTLKRIESLEEALKNAGVIGGAPKKTLGVDETRLMGSQKDDYRDKVTALFNQRR